METLRILSWFSPLVALMLGWRYRRFSLLWMYCLLALLIDSLAYMIRFVWKFPFDLPNIGNLFLLMELLIFGKFFYHYLFKKNKLFGCSVLVVSFVFLVHTLMNGVYEQNKIGSLFLLLGYMVACMFGFRSILKEQKIAHLERSFTFWSLVAILWYAAGSFFIFLALSIFDDAVTNRAIYLLIYTNINLVRYLILGVALYQKND